ncbi:MAG: GAF and ANTAR domain-containing protein [Actinobacteria bacterium]|nr:GAF and ANTAR domain-containing protein [Actinomycetota bacterium]MBU2111006.1 GAF and ANTAR domain-containing protein [Actinomycetota bacterium]
MSEMSDILIALLDDPRRDLGLPELVCRDAVRRLGSVGGAALCLGQDELELDLVAGSDDAAVALERKQLDLGEGPCLDAHRTGAIVHLTDPVDDRERWPLYSRAVQEAGVRAVLALPLRVGGIRLGALDLYLDRPGTLTGTELTWAVAYAETSVLVLLHLHEEGRDPAAAGTSAPDVTWLSEHLLEDDAFLDAAFQGAPEVHQATGMVAVQADVTLTEALLLLRARAFASGRSLPEVARAVVARHVRFP